MIYLLVIIYIINAVSFALVSITDDRRVWRIWWWYIFLVIAPLTLLAIALGYSIKANK